MVEGDLPGPGDGYRRNRVGECDGVTSRATVGLPAKWSTRSGGSNKVSPCGSALAQHGRDRIDQAAAICSRSRSMSRSLTGLRIDSWSEKDVSDSYQYQDVLTDKNGWRRGDGEKELCLVRGRNEEVERGAYYRQDASELRSSQEQRNQPGQWHQQSTRNEEPREHWGPQLVYASLDSQRSQQEAENKAQPKQDCQYSLCSAERRDCLG